MERYLRNRLDLPVIQNSKLFHNLIKTDLIRDKQIHNIDYYKPSHMIASMVSAYPQVILYRSLSLMSEHKDYFPEFSYHLSHDPSFTLPVLVILTNFILLKGSEHPFLINMRKEWSITWQSLFCLYGSAMFIVLPQSYSIAYLSYLGVHLVIRALRRKPCLD